VISEGVITYTITDFSALNLGSDIALSWSMSCANDVLQDVVDLTPVQATPLPAALPLFASGLGAMGLIGWRRKRKAQAN
jgi:hypothetical protein